MCEKNFMNKKKTYKCSMYICIEKFKRHMGTFKYEFIIANSIFEFELKKLTKRVLRDLWVLSIVSFFIPNSTFEFVLSHMKYVFDYLWIQLGARFYKQENKGDRTKCRMLLSFLNWKFS